MINGNTKNNKMDITLVLLVVVGIFLCIFLYTTFNLLKKVEILEDSLQQQNQIFLSIEREIIESRKYINTLDERGIFQADDEVGVFFSAMKQIQNTLDNYTRDNAKEEI